ncbi:hypothetical protein MXM41_07135 [Leclercia adecarboxylata]|uniref:hypothetical protein n=1 Tax=Leclercia adecarboxylata TaxID=83655 RepID=UPI002DBE8319|nr:hypothetical protein [Leclercia adecarboxylata]MEB6378707.1 hypothetical protein [Leclercia adecarboxylata]
MTPLSSAYLTRYLWLAAAAGLLMGLVIIFFWPELASWWPEDLPRIYSTLYFLIGTGQTGPDTIPLAIYGKLVMAGFVLAFMHPGHGKIPLVAWMLHNQPTSKQFFDWIVRSWILQCGFFVIIFWRIGFTQNLSHEVLLRFVAVFNYVCYFATLILGVLLVRDALCRRESADRPASNIRLPLIFALGFYLPSQVVWLLLGAREYDLTLTGWLLFVPTAVGMLLARLATGGVACLLRQQLGGVRCQRGWRYFALFNGVAVLAMVTNAFIRILWSLLH